MTMANIKTVHVLAHGFDCLPGHVTIGAYGSGSNLRAAVIHGVREALKDKRLSRKRIGEFKMSVVVIGGAS